MRVEAGCGIPRSAPQRPAALGYLSSPRRSALCARALPLPLRLSGPELSASCRVCVSCYPGLVWIRAPSPGVILELRAGPPERVELDLHHLHQQEREPVLQAAAGAGPVRLMPLSSSGRMDPNRPEARADQNLNPLWKRTCVCSARATQLQQITEMRKRRRRRVRVGMRAADGSVTQQLSSQRRKVKYSTPTLLV